MAATRADPFKAPEREQIERWFAHKLFGIRPGPGSTQTRRVANPAYGILVHLLFNTGLRPSEAAGLQWQDIDLDGHRLHVQRSRHLYDDGAPKTASADRWVELFPKTVALLRTIQPLHTEPEQYVFTTTEGKPIEPKAFASRFWYRCLRTLGLRVRGIYATKDTFVTTALKAGVKVAWLENQTGVGYATLKRHYGKWFHDGDDTELRRFAACPGSLQRTEIFLGSRRSFEEGGGKVLLAELDGGAQDGMAELGDAPAARAGNLSQPGRAGALTRTFGEVAPFP